jgi:ATP-dependent DNA helicase DinG
VVVTSATLGNPPEAAAGAVYLHVTPHIFRVESPFDYARQARIFIATDVQRQDTASLAHAYHALIEAAGGGTLGLFTAIARLRAVHARLADRMARAGLALFAQHVDAVDTGTLVDLFRADPHATLFGTDALRDGVDVPGDSLRLIVFEGVPWSRPTILNTARRSAFGGSAYEDIQVKHRLAQAFGRLIRSADDRGAFVLLGASVPSRLLAAFPPEVPVARVPLETAAREIRAFLAGDCAGEEPPLGVASAASR